jgi:AcrR family transcriptional regulator
MASDVITYDGRMSRWQPDARERLERAAVELFTEQGFAATTVPQITERAGLTTRTFFRHFADKREVLFGGDELPRLAAALIAAAPPSVDPAVLVVDGLTTFATARFEGRRAEIRQWRAIVSCDEGLRERELRKRDAVLEAVRSGLAGRGVGATTAAVLAGTAVTLLYTAVDRWVEAEDERPLAEFIQDGVRALRAALDQLPLSAREPTSAGHSPGL